MQKSLLNSLGLAAALALAAPSQAQTNEDFQTWGTLTATGSLGIFTPELKNFKYWLEGQGRFGNDTSRFSQGMARTGLGYALSDKVSIWLGYAFIPTEEPFAKVPFDEHRIWQQLLWSEKIADTTFTSRSRLEQRFVQTGNDVGWRYRQLLKASYAPAAWNGFSLVASDEFFANVNNTDWRAHSGFDQNRFFVGVGYSFDSHVKTEVGYMHQYINKNKAQDLMDHILSVNFILNY